MLFLQLLVVAITTSCAFVLPTDSSSSISNELSDTARKSLPSHIPAGVLVHRRAADDDTYYTKAANLRTSSLANIGKALDRMVNLSKEKAEARQMALLQLGYPVGTTPIQAAQHEWNKEVAGYTRYIKALRLQNPPKLSVEQSMDLLKDYVAKAEASWSRRPELKKLGAANKIDRFPGRRGMGRGSANAAVQRAKSVQSFTDDSDLKTAHRVANEVQAVDARRLVGEQNPSKFSKMLTENLHDWDETLGELHVAG